MIAREPRHQTHTSIILTARGYGRFFTVKNVSRSGAGIQGDKQLRVGEPVTLNFPEKRVHGTVRWSDGHRAGVHFSETLDDNVLGRLVQQAPQEDWLEHARAS